MKVLAILSAAGSIIAGLYLLDTQAVGENSLLETLMHGIGLYFLARGVFQGATLWVQDDLRTLLADVVGARLEKDRREQVRRATEGDQVA